MTVRLFCPNHLLRIVLLAAAYFLTGRLGLLVPYAGSEVTLIWPPTGISLAALLIWGWRSWPGVCLGAFLVAWWAGPPWPAALAIGIGNTLGPLAGAVLLQRVAGFRGGFDRQRDLLTFVLIGALGSMLIPATVGTFSLCLAGRRPWDQFDEAWLGWWLGDTVGVLIFAPPLLTAEGAVALVRQGRRAVAELLTVLAAVAGFGILVFTDLFGLAERGMPLAFLPFPLLIWAGLRQGAWGTSAAALLLSVAAVTGTALGLGPFAATDVQAGLMLLWAYMSTATGVALMTAALQAERTAAETALRASERASQEARWILETVMNNIPQGVFWKDRQSVYLGGNVVVARAMGFTHPDQLVGLTDHDFPSLARHQADFYVLKDRQVMESGQPELGILETMDLPDGSQIWLETSKLPFRDRTGAVIGVLGTWQDITDRKRAEEKLLASLREKEALLKEVHHRVKNNLQIVSSLLSLQAGQAAEPAALAVLRECQHRIHAMALIHETLYRSADLARVDLPRYLRTLCEHLFRSYGADADRVELRLRLDDAALDLDRAIPCGLIVTELTSNALKYAFPDGRRGWVAVTLDARESGKYTLSISDNGIGLPAGLDVPRAESLGLHLVGVLTRQLRGELTLDRTAGTGFTITFRA